MKIINFISVFIIGINSPAIAQLWKGSLGDPVVNITFGSGSNPGPKVPAGQTTYTYSASTCPNQEEYSILNLTFGCFTNSWHSLSGDHTPNDAGGYFMLINGGDSKGDLFVYTIRSLCPNTTYEFASWIRNMLRPTACDKNGIKPNLTFKIETVSGTVLATSNSGDIPNKEDPAWEQYGIVFKTSATNTDIVLRISNTASAGCGNVIALDDITLRPCGDPVNAKIASNGSTNVDVCEGNNTSFLLSANYGSGFTNPLFQWQILGPGNNWQNISGANSKSFLTKTTGVGTYIYRMLIGEASSYSLPQCGIASNEISVNIIRAPFVQATNYIYGCLGGDVTLFCSGANKYVWSGPNGYTSTSQSPVLAQIQYSDSGLYKVTGITEIGCENSDSTILKVYPNATAVASEGAFICEGTPTMLVAGGGIRYQWYPVTGLSSDTIASPRASPTETTLYSVKVTNQYGCSDTAQIKINVWKKPEADAGPDLKTRAGYPIVLKGSAKGSDVSWYWSPSASLSSSLALTPTTNPQQTMMYTLHVTSGHGCGTSTDTTLVKVYNKIQVPNAFSPNGDGINDSWVIDPLYLFDESVTEVYNRYGEIVYRSRGYSTPWNGMSKGKPLPIGTYYYIIDFNTSKEPKVTGSVTIIR